ncbi:MAG: GDSL-type esterase/lipase family protein [Candidatus Sumerlaeia bacterium]|nr:GDSL-type esterase/lipase family protein [Candidatus Sumerlaeia bacterium]
MHERSGRRPRRRQWRIAAVGLGTCLAVELAAFIFYTAFQPRHPNEFLRHFRQHPYRAYMLVPGARSGDGRFSINTQGFRGPEISPAKPSGVFRIACLGDEVTFGDSATTDSHTWPARMEQALRARNHAASSQSAGIEVINAGVPGYTSLESLIHFETWLLDYNLDAAVFHHGFNDAVFMACFKDFAPDYTHARRVFWDPKPRWWERSFLLSLGLRRFDTAANPWGMGPAMELSQLLLTDAGCMAVSDEQKQAYFKPERMRVFARNLRSFVFVARAHGVEPVLSTTVCGPPAGFLAEVVGRLNDCIRQTAASLDVRCIDIAAKMPWSAESFEDMRQPRDSPAGLERLGLLFAEELAHRKQESKRQTSADGGLSP